MKKHVLLTLAALAGLLLASCAGATSTAAPAEPTSPPAEGALPDLGGQTITVAVENAYPPFNSMDEGTNEAIGWDYDSVREICDRLNCVPEFKQAAWDGIFPAMQAGEYDMLADGVTYTAERDEIVDFSIPYVTVGQVLLIKEDAPIADVEAFKADSTKVVGTQIGTTNEMVAKEHFPEDRVQSFEEFGGAVAALNAGDIDAVVIDNISALGFIAENEGLAVGPQLTSDEQLAFVFPPDSDLTAAVDAALEAMQADGTLEEINGKWFNP